MTDSGGRAPLAVVGIGNTLAGDDGAGVKAVELLRERLDGRSDGIVFALLEGDMLGVADMLHLARRFVFLDAVAGESPGRIVRSRSAPRAMAPSFHQADIGVIMERLRELEMIDPFPDWEIIGVTVDPPRMLGEGLSPVVAAGVEELVTVLETELGGLGGDS
jgi:hydrogenase maturation protease